MKLHFPCWFPTHKIYLVLFNQIEFANANQRLIIKNNIGKISFVFYLDGVDSLSLSHWISSKIHSWPFHISATWFDDYIILILPSQKWLGRSFNNKKKKAHKLCENCFLSLFWQFLFILTTRETSFNFPNENTHIYITNCCARTINHSSQKCVFWIHLQFLFVFNSNHTFPIEFFLFFIVETKKSTECFVPK